MPTINLYIPVEYDDIIKNKIKTMGISKTDYIMDLIKRDCEKRLSSDGIS